MLCNLFRVVALITVCYVFSSVAIASTSALLLENTPVAMTYNDPETGQIIATGQIAFNGSSELQMSLHIAAHSGATHIQHLYLNTTPAIQGKVFFFDGYRDASIVTSPDGFNFTLEFGGDPGLDSGIFVRIALDQPLSTGLIINGGAIQGYGVGFKTTSTKLPADFLASPVLLTEENSGRAAALNSLTWMRDPFSLITPYNFSSDHRTRITLFTANLELRPGESPSAVVVEAEDALHNVYPLPVEYVGKVPDMNWITQVLVKLTDQLGNSGDMLISIKYGSNTSNKAAISIKPLK